MVANIVFQTESMVEVRILDVSGLILQSLIPSSNPKFRLESDVGEAEGIIVMLLPRG